MNAGRWIDLWPIPLDSGSDTAIAADLALLSEAERERAGRFVFGHHRARFTAAHGALRRILAGYVGAAPAALAFDVGVHGKPALRGAPVIGFNLSDTSTHAVVAVAAGAVGPIGVDVEALDGDPDVDGLVARVLTADEQADVAAAAVSLRKRRFLQYWTIKEAALKAAGTGLSLEPDRISVHWAAASDAAAARGGMVIAIGPHAQLQSGGPWRFASFVDVAAADDVALTGAGRLVAALCWQGDDALVRVRSYDRAD